VSGIHRIYFKPLHGTLRTVYTLPLLRFYNLIELPEDGQQKLLSLNFRSGSLYASVYVGAMLGSTLVSDRFDDPRRIVAKNPFVFIKFKRPILSAYGMNTELYHYSINTGGRRDLPGEGE
jgi:hypothetical protein